MDWSGLEKRPKSRNDVFAKMSSRNNDTVCIWGRSEKKAAPMQEHYYTAEVRCILGRRSENLLRRHENYIHTANEKVGREYHRRVIGTQSLTGEYESF